MLNDVLARITALPPNIKPLAQVLAHALLLLDRGPPRRYQEEGLSNLSWAHMYSLDSVPCLMWQPHYQAGTFQEDMIANLSHAVLPSLLLCLVQDQCGWSLQEKFENCTKYLVVVCMMDPIYQYGFKQLKEFGCMKRLEVLRHLHTQCLRCFPRHLG